MDEPAEQHGAIPANAIRQQNNAARQDRRSGIERRSEAGNDQGARSSDRRQGERRRLRRIPAPMAGIGLLSGQLIHSGRLLTFKVWDYTEAGICVILTTPMELSPGSAAVQVQLQNDSGPLGAPIAADLRWQALVGSSLFCGLRFHQALQAGPFFERYLRKSGHAHHQND